MQQRIVLVFLLVAVSLPLACRAADQTVSDWTLPDSDGQSVHFFDAAEDQVSVVLFWATWCPYCRTLMPHLQAIADDYTGAPVDFYALNILEDGDPEAHMRKHGYTFRLIPEADPVADDYGIEGTPGLLVVGPGRELLYERRSGTGDEQVEAAVRKTIERALNDL